MEIFWLNGNLTLQPQTQAERNALRRLIKATTYINHGFPPHRTLAEEISGEEEKVLFAGESDTSVPAKQVTNGAV
jgi:hypothetical protein